MGQCSLIFWMLCILCTVPSSSLFPHVLLCWFSPYFLSAGWYISPEYLFSWPLPGLPFSSLNVLRCFMPGAPYPLSFISNFSFPRNFFIVTEERWFSMMPSKFATFKSFLLNTPWYIIILCLIQIIMLIVFQVLLCAELGCVSLTQNGFSKNASVCN